MRIEYYIDDELLSCTDFGAIVNRDQYDLFEDYFEVREALIRSITTQHLAIVTPFFLSLKRKKPVSFMVFESKMNKWPVSEEDDSEPFDLESEIEETPGETEEAEEEEISEPKEFNFSGVTDQDISVELLFGHHDRL